ncbi:hypothetical protein AAFF_G00061440 [Aldrovandia affinis]|uniref:Uncharacterized protein n=1 Tax=Aldrovandia affinis TaxID=143900 RepID=A0AAD7RZU7_9TELE|nr:hypothetical protein AAFF_G00061440 [Aldrovandia affinis]
MIINNAVGPRLAAQVERIGSGTPTVTLARGASSVCAPLSSAMQSGNAGNVRNAGTCFTAHCEPSLRLAHFHSRPAPVSNGEGTRRGTVPSKHNFTFIQ